MRPASEEKTPTCFASLLTDWWLAGRLFPSPKVTLPSIGNMSRPRRRAKSSSLAQAIILDVSIPASQNNMASSPVVVIVAALLYLMAARHQRCPSSSWEVNAEATHQPQPQHQHQHHHEHHGSVAFPPVYVDTKYWIRSTEFGDQDNWLNQLRPCTLFERIKMNEQSVVSMGSSMDALGGSLLNANSIKELTLAQNGMLLLEEDLPEEPVDSAFVQYLKLIGDCADSDSLQQQPVSLAGVDEQQQLLQQQARHLFEFEPDSDKMSWFNPENWSSTPNEYNVEEWIPESHQIPCSEDVVVFGDRHGLTAYFLELGERDKTASFKVNFRSSMNSLMQAQNGAKAQGEAAQAVRPAIVDWLRVSRLIIGDRHYDQQEFEKLIQSDDYKNILFQFNDSMSALRPNSLAGGGPLYSDASGGSSPLAIDESSLVRDSSQNICLDEAGCLCGNERSEVMKVICSFHEPLAEHEIPCHDPIYSAGHCNKICATSLTISMEPTQFSERFVSSIITDMMKEHAQPDGSVLIGPRRIDDDKYEILFRYIPNDDQQWASSGFELELAQTMQRLLEKGSTKSFYGIKSITTRSSRQWRKDNQSLIFWLTSGSLSLISIVVLALKNADVGQDSGLVSSGAADAQRWMNNIWVQVRHQSSGGVPMNSAGADPFTEFANRSMPQSTDHFYGSLSNIPLMEIDENGAKEDGDSNN